MTAARCPERRYQKSPLPESNTVQEPHHETAGNSKFRAARQQCCRTEAWHPLAPGTPITERRREDSQRVRSPCETGRAHSTRTLNKDDDSVPQREIRPASSRQERSLSSAMCRRRTRTGRLRGSCLPWRGADARGLRRVQSVRERVQKKRRVCESLRHRIPSIIPQTLASAERG